MSSPYGPGEPDGHQPWSGHPSGPHYQYPDPGQHSPQSQQQSGYGYPVGQYPGQQQWGGQPPGYPMYSSSANQLPAARPGVVLAAAIIAFLLGALLAIGGAVIIGASKTADSDGNFLGLNGLAGIVVAVGVILILVAALLIWGGVWAVNGKSYLLLLISASVIGALALIGLIENLSNGYDPTGGIVGAIACAVVVALLASSQSRSWFASKHR